MGEKDIMEIDERKMALLIRMRDWFDDMSSRGWNVKWYSTTMGGNAYTRVIIGYLDDMIERGWYSDSEQNVLNWIRGLWILNGMGRFITNPITTI
jgi:hypothetical protein